jgi:perosamine synthetase
MIPVCAPVIGEREVAFVNDAVRSGWVSSVGPYLNRFESAFANYVGSAHAVAVSSGTAALHLTLAALGLTDGDEVVIPDLTFAATAHAVLQTGATPVLVDIHPITWCLDPDAVRRAVGPRTKAIIAVHLYGQPADTQALGEIADELGVPLIEDAAEAHGGQQAGQNVGSLGLVGAFSFYGNKIITTGEGGMLTTNDDDLADRLRFLKDQGMTKDRRYFHTELAFNYRMTNLQAALGLAQVEQIEDFIEAKRRIRSWYGEELDGMAGMQLNSEATGSRNVFWMTCAILAEYQAADRDRLVVRLRERGIDTRPFFIPMSQLPHMANLRQVGVTGDGCPMAASVSAQGINLPSGCGLNRSEVRRAATTLRELL